MVVEMLMAMAQPLTLKSGAAANYNFHPSHSSVSDLAVTFSMWA